MVKALPDEFMENLIQDRQIPGVSLAVISKGRILQTNGYGRANLEWDIPATEATVYALASATKALTGTALMVLTETEGFSLDTPIQEWVPNVPGAWKPVTVRNCMTHTSGLPDILSLTPTIKEKPESREELLDRLADLPLEFGPGERIAYNQTGYFIAESILEAVSRKPYEAFMEECLFRPLGMTQTRFRRSVVHAGRYYSTPIEKRVGLYERIDGHLSNMDYLYGQKGLLAAAGLNSSVVDLAKFDAALSPGHLLREESLRQMWAPMLLTNGEAVGYGVGWNLGEFEKHRYVGHQGGVALSHFTRFADARLTVVLLANLDSYDLTFAEMVYARLLG